MKSKNLFLGKELSREEQKRITGGSGTCNVGQYMPCLCNGNHSICAPATVNNEFWSQICGDACQAQYSTTGFWVGSTCYGDSECGF
jgi:hypothetical protein